MGSEGSIGSEGSMGKGRRCAPNFLERTKNTASFLWKEVPEGRRLGDAQYRKIRGANLNWDDKFPVIPSFT